MIDYCNFPCRPFAEWDAPTAVTVVDPRCYPRYFRKRISTSVVDDYRNLLKLFLDNSKNTLGLYLLPRYFDESFDPLLPQYYDRFIYYPFKGCLYRLNDIWIKDFAPLPSLNSQGNVVYVKARYSPRYLTEKDSSYQDLVGSSLANVLERPAINFPLSWDLGNFTHNGHGTAIVTDRIVEDNPDISLDMLRNMFSSFLGIDNLIIIKQEPGDITGHIDGTVRFISRDTLVIAQYPPYLEDENRYIHSIKEDIIKQSSFPLSFVDIPCGLLFDLPKDGVQSVFGNHINFLWAGDHIYVPVYNIPSDIPALEIYEKHIKDCIVCPVYISALPHFGGALNCMTWKVF